MMEKKATILLFHFVGVFVTYVVAILTVIGWFAGVTPPQSSWFVTVLGLGMMPLLIVNILLLLWWILRRKLVAIVPAAVILLNIGFITSMFNIGIGGPDDDGCQLKVASYNIHGYSQQDLGGMLESVVRYLQAEEVDVVGFQEFPITDRLPLDSLRAVFSPYMPYSVAAEDGSDVSVALFSRYPIGDHDILKFEKTANGALWADIDVAGERIRVFNAHFQTTSINQSRREIESVRERGITDYQGKKAFDAVMNRLYENSCMRTEQVDRVRAIMDTTSRGVIVCGDFNDTPASYTYKQIKKGLHDGFRRCGRGYAYTFKPMLKLLRADYIFFDKRYTGLRYYSPNLMWSDHNPVILELSFDD